jgi:ribonuclease Z
VKPSYHPQLVNGARGDPALYIEFMFEARAILFDLGDLAPLPSRKILRISDIFVSHTHMDHFIGFDHLLRIMVGRDKQIRLYGPPGIIAQTAHKLAGYTWNLVENYQADLILSVMEVHPDGSAQRARFRCRSGFRREEQDKVQIHDGVLLDEGNLRVRCAVLDHKIPCLAFALEERQHVNVWKNRLNERGLPTGPWLHTLKQAVLKNAANDTLVPGPGGEGQLSLGELKRDILRIVPGQKIGYVVDTLYNESNVQRIINLTQGAEQLFIEAPFLQQDAAHAEARYHLTARQAGELARRAGVKHCIPFHFSARYSGEEDTLLREALAAFNGDETSS